MPLEHAQWFAKQSAPDHNTVRARQCCTYYSVVNVDKTDSPSRSAYEQQQTWTLSRSMANNRKRYQTSIENIFLAPPTLSLRPKSLDYELVKVERDQPAPYAVPPATERTTNVSRPLLYTSVKSINQQDDRPLPLKSILSKNSTLKNSVTVNEPRHSIRSMRVIHINGELLVRI